MNLCQWPARVLVLGGATSVCPAEAAPGLLLCPVHGAICAKDDNELSEHERDEISRAFKPWQWAHFRKQIQDQGAELVETRAARDRIARLYHHEVRP